MCKSQNTNLDSLKSHLLAGDICVFPTDTVVGIGCCAFEAKTGRVNADALKKIFKIKNRDSEKKLPWLIGDYSWVERYAAHMPFELEPFANKYWPGATTLVVAANDSVDDVFCAKPTFTDNSKPAHTSKVLRTLALRVPKSDWLLTLLRKINIPIVCTSANVSGEPAVANIKDVSADVLKQADFVFDCVKEKCAANSPSGKPSKIFDCTSEDFKRLR